MKATLIQKERIRLGDDRFVEVAIWAASAPVPPATHGYKYRLAFVVGEICVVRYDNERGKGDHKHVGALEAAYAFTTLDQLVEDFWADVERLETEMDETTLTIGIDSIQGVKQRMKAALHGGPADATLRYFFLSVEDMARTLTPGRWGLIAALTGSGPLGVRELARRVNRDVKAVHTDAQALVLCGLVDKASDGKLLFPYQHVKVQFEVHARAA